MQVVENKTTQKLELHFEKAAYLELSEGQKKSLKSAFLWSKTGGCWVSRAKLDNCYWARKTVKDLGFDVTSAETVGQRPTYAEELDQKAEKAENRADRYNQYAENAETRAGKLQSGINAMHGDIAFFTQPIIAGHSGSQAFARRREKMFNQYHKGFEEYRKSEYFKGKAAAAEGAASKAQLGNKTYLYNKIEEQKKLIKKIEENIIRAEEKQRDDLLEKYLDRYEYEADKQAFFENYLDELGGVTYDNGNIKPGYLVKIRGYWRTVVKANPKTIEAQTSGAPFTLKYPYAAIQEVKIPGNWTEPAAEITENPFTVGDVLVWYHHANGEPFFLRTYQVIKTTAKQVTLCQLSYDGINPPTLNNFKAGARPINRAIKKSKFYDSWVVCVDDYALQKYSPAI